MSAIDLSDPETIASLADALTRAGVEGLEITTPAGHLRIMLAKGSVIDISRSSPAPVAAFFIKAPLAGRFRPGGRVGEAASTNMPQQVSEGDILGFIAVGPILLPLSASRPGTLRRVLADVDALVGFGEPLFELEPSQ